MKKRMIVLIVFLGIVGGNNVFARGSDFSDAKILGAGFSLSYSYEYPFGRSLSIPPLVAYLEMGMHEYVTVGPFVAFSRWDYSDRSRSFLTVGGRGSFHLTPFINDWFDAAIDERQWDIYGAMASGLNFRHYGAFEHQDESGFGRNIRFFLGPIVGARYYLAEETAVYSELGVGPLGALTVGVSVNL